MALAKRFYILFVAFILSPLMALPVWADITTLENRSFEVVHKVTLNAAPDSVWNTATGDISGWWDHRFSNDPARFFIDARPGGGFYEYFGKDGKSGVLHARVIYADPAKRLTMTGPLGFNGHAVTIVTTWAFDATDNGKTDLTARISVSGVYQDGWQDALEAVWTHFLSGRLKGYIDAGCRGGAPCEDFP